MRDRPEAAGGAGRDPLGDLRERLARLPAGHPSSPDYRPAQERDGTAARDRGPAGDQAAGDQAGGDQAGGDQAGGDQAVYGEPAGGDPVAGEAAPGQERPDGPHRRGAQRPEDAGRDRPGPPPPRGQGPGLPGRGEQYRPWFSAGDEPQPWFSPESGDRSA